MNTLSNFATNNSYSSLNSTFYLILFQSNLTLKIVMSTNDLYTLLFTETKTSL